MSTYRTGNHWGVTIVREPGDGEQWACSACGYQNVGGICTHCGNRSGELVAVVVNGEQELAERICALLNDAWQLPHAIGILGEARRLRREGEGIGTWAAWDRMVEEFIEMRQVSASPAPLAAEKPTTRGTGRAEPCIGLCAGCDPGCAFVGDSCSCSIARHDPGCVVHQGRRARGPKPPPLGPGCICDGSGRTCPRHGAVI